jgi:Zn-dependent peptidase ImmA (M78 family)
MQVQEAQELNLGYKAIRKIASVFQETLIGNSFDLESVLKSMGAKITLVDSISFEKCENFFCSSTHESFEVTALSDNEMLKRVFLAQALGHYVLHAQRGLKPCKVSSVTKNEASKEGFYFSLALLLKDEVVIKMIEDGFNNKQIANLFRVPEKIVEIKRVILKNNGDI